MNISTFGQSLAARIRGSARVHGFRAQFTPERLRDAVNVAPWTAGASMVVAAVFVAGAHGSPAFPWMAAWALVLCGMLAFDLRRWRRTRRAPREAAASATVFLAVARLSVSGMLWGTAPLIASMTGAGGLELMIVMGILAVLCAAAFLHAALPAVYAAFALPVLAGLVAAAGQLGHSPASTSVVLALTIFLIFKLANAQHAARISRDQAVQRHVREQKDIISLLLKEFEEDTSDWLWEFDTRGRIRRVSDRFASVAVRRPEALAGLDFCAFLREGSDHNEPFVAEIGLKIAERATFHDVVVKMEIGGEERWWRLSGKPAQDCDGRYKGYIGTASDITAERLVERRISFLAHHDALTGLFNRSKFTEYLNYAVGQLGRYGKPFSVLYLDLDQFKSVNDTRGHLIGDKLLAQVSARLQETVRETDIVARLGGDEFALIVGSDCDADHCAALAERLVERLCKPYLIDNDTLSIGVSIGIAMAPNDGTRPDQILRNADLALYRAKAEGRGTYRFFETQMDADLRERRMLELELRQAIADGEFVLHYQPLVSAQGHGVIGFEALIRWNHPIRGILPPSEFIPIAEQSGLIQQLGDWTIREACRAASTWPEGKSVAVNLSVKHFQMSDIAAVVGEALAESGLPADRLELEITESLLLQNPEQVIAKLTDIKALGVTIAMDDFGTGYSSLSYLLKFPFDKIKIDKSFVTASSSGTAAREILRTIVSLGRSLNICVTAEGVETLDQVEFLSEIECNQLQGYYFSRPFAETGLPAYLMKALQAKTAYDDSPGLAREPRIKLIHSR